MGFIFGRWNRKVGASRVGEYIPIAGLWEEILNLTYQEKQRGATGGKEDPGNG